MSSIYSRRDAVEAFCIWLLIDAVLPLAFWFTKWLHDYFIVAAYLVAVQLLFSIGLFIFKSHNLSEENYNFLKYGFTFIILRQAYRYWH